MYYIPYRSLVLFITNSYVLCGVFFKYTATTEIYTYCHTLSLHDARPSLRPGPPGGRGMTSPMQDECYNFAYLDEQTKRMIRRCILKAVAVPGYQVPLDRKSLRLHSSH